MANKKVAGKNAIDGIIMVALSYTMWGILPLYWKALNSVPSDQIIAHRIIWSVAFMAVILAVSRGFGSIKASVSNKRDMVIITMCALLIAANWYTYIWAVNSNHIVESSMGYYINPLVSVLLGVVVLKEKLDIYKCIALFLAAAGIVIMAVEYGKIPWIALILAATFGLYGLLKKLVKASASVGLALETVILLPAAAGYVIWLECTGAGAMGKLPLPLLVLILCAGIVTATPLLLFGAGAKKVELSTVGFLQYLSPTISLILGVFVYKEHFSTIELISFGMIWLGLIVFSVSRLDLRKWLQQGKEKSLEQ